MTRRAAGKALPILPCLAVLPLALGLASCGGDDMPTANRSGPVKVQGSPIRTVGAGAAPGTPMAQRTAVVGLLNKRNGLTRDLTMKPGEALRVGDAIVRVQACETTAPWENIQDTGAFVQLDVRSSADGKWRRAFSGWLFRDRPDRNVVQHPVYDVWVRSCAMEWPETGPDTVKLGGEGKPAASSPRASASNASEASAPDPESTVPAPSATPPTASPSN